MNEKQQWDANEKRGDVKSIMTTPSSQGLRRRRGASTILVRGGGRLSILVMGVTVAGMLILVLVQGSFYIGSYSWFHGSVHKSDAKLLLDLHRNLRANNQPTASLEQVREKFLQQLKQKDSNICSLLPKQYRQHNNDQAMKQLWIRYIGLVLAASQHPDDPEYTHEEWTKRLLAELPPSLLQSAVRIKPPSHTTDRILEIIRQRLLHPDTAPPLRVAVVGGAIAEGAGCEVASIAIPEGSIMANPTYCAWPYRLEAFLNRILGNGVVQVVNMAEEGTDTGFMTPLVKNWIYPPSLLPHGPDIVVNAYGRVDYASYQEGDSDLEETIQSELTSFRRAVETSHPCGHAPLVVHLDDVSLDLVDKSNVLSIQHADAVSRVLRIDPPPNDALFSMAGHVGMAWVVAYGLLQVAVEHCAGPTLLTPTPLVSAVSTEDQNRTSTCQDPSTGEASCPFAFFASPMGTVRKVPEVQRYIQPFVVHNAGWQVLSDMSTGWSRKTGLVAVEPDAKIFFKISNITKEIRYFHLMSLKSNGERWQRGKARFRLAILPNSDASQAMETTFDIEGHHESDNHVTYHFTLDFEDNKAPVGSDVMMSVELVEGSSFKILGMMLCS